MSGSLCRRLMCYSCCVSGQHFRVCRMCLPVTVSSLSLFVPCHCISVPNLMFAYRCTLMSIPVCLSLCLLQCVSVTGCCESVYVSVTLGLPISVPVCHHVCSPMCHHLPRCRRVRYSPPRPQVGVSGPLVPGRGPSPSHPRLPWARLGACLQCLPQVNTKIRNPRATSLTSVPCPLAWPGLGLYQSPTVAAPKLEMCPHPPVTHGHEPPPSP